MSRSSAVRTLLRRHGAAPARAAFGRVCIVIFIVLPLLAPLRARAAACCTSASVAGAGRLMVWEQAAAGTRLSASWGAGRWDTRGGWRPRSPEWSELDFTTELWGIVRGGERLQFSARAPWLINTRRSGAVAQTGHGLGDLQAGARYEIISVGEFRELPAVALSLGVLAPTGTRAEASPLPLGAGATGRGAWEASLAAELEQTWGPWFARLDVGGRGSLAFRRGDLGVDQRYGPGVMAALSGGKELVDRLVVALAIAHEREGRLSLAGRPVEGSGASATSVSAALSWRPWPHWTLQASASSGLFTGGLGANRPGAVISQIGVRYGHF